MILFLIVLICGIRYCSSVKYINGSAIKNSIFKLIDMMKISKLGSINLARTIDNVDFNEKSP